MTKLTDSDGKKRLEQKLFDNVIEGCLNSTLL